jgi:hypothetical protein
VDLQTAHTFVISFVPTLLVFSQHDSPEFERCLVTIGGIDRRYSINITAFSSPNRLSISVCINEAIGELRASWSGNIRQLHQGLKPRSVPSDLAVQDVAVSPQSCYATKEGWLFPNPATDSRTTRKKFKRSTFEPRERQWALVRSVQDGFGIAPGSSQLIEDFGCGGKI